MSQMTDLYLKKETLKILLDTVERKGDKGVTLTISINDEANDYGQNVSATVAQSKEDREAGKKKFYVGNGKTFWSNKGEFKPDRVQQVAATAGAGQVDDGDDLPF